MADINKFDLSTPPKNYEAFGRAVWATLTRKDTVALSEGFPQHMAVVAINAGLKAAQKAPSKPTTVANTVLLSQSESAPSPADETARAWSARAALGLDTHGRGNA